MLLRGDTELVVEGVVPDLRRRTGSGAQHRRGEHKDQTTRQGHHTERPRGCHAERATRREPRGGHGHPHTSSRLEMATAHLLHVVPVGHDAVLDRVLEREDATLRLRLVADVRVLLAHANHHTRLARAADDRREDGARGVIAREAGLFRAREKRERCE